MLGQLTRMARPTPTGEPPRKKLVSGPTDAPVWVNEDDPRPTVSGPGPFGVTSGTWPQILTAQNQFYGAGSQQHQQPSALPGQPGGGSGTGTGLGTNYGAGGQINTSITPQNIYSPQQTTAATNQAVAAQHAQGDPYAQFKRFDRPGVSRGAQTGALALPGIMAGKLGAANAAAMLPFEDAQANAQHILSGQLAREGEAIDWGNLLARLEETQSRLRTSGIQPGLSLLNALLG